MARTAATASALDQSAVQHLIGYRLALAEVATRRVFQRHIGTPFKLRPVEFTVLLLLLASGAATPKQLASTLHVPPPNVTVLVDRLVERGLLLRQRSDTDGRALNLRLTDAGQDLARRAQRASRSMETGMLSALSVAERAMLGELLHKLVQGGTAAAPA